VELIILALLAAVVLYQLYAVLGRRVGRQPEDLAKAAAEREAQAPPPVVRPHEPVRAHEPEGLAAIRAREPSFDLDGFLQGAKGAYEMIVRSFAEGDRETLRGLLAPDVLRSWEGVIADREAQGRTETVEFRHAPRADVDHVDADGRTARIRVRFLAEFRSRTKGPEGEAVDDRRTAELWTFERELGTRDPNWTLVRVEPAEA
jgi:predicted lipid-binding transport protein (Tim44 family)